MEFSHQQGVTVSETEGGECAATSNIETCPNQRLGPRVVFKCCSVAFRARPVSDVQGRFHCITVEVKVVVSHGTSAQGGFTFDERSPSLFGVLGRERKRAKNCPAKVPKTRLTTNHKRLSE